MDIKVNELSYIYQAGTPFESKALESISLSIDSGQFVSFLGHTGSGKSTLVQHLNGLLKPTKGEVHIGKTIISNSSGKKDLKALRKRVGIVFQYPEHQLFEETVEKDICFGPKNYGATDEEAKRIAREVLEVVGLPTSLLERSPFDLSGGQMRRVAIAGVLALEPEVLILDEPSAGLDPRAKEDMMALYASLHEEKGLTTIMVTHSMEDAALRSEKIFVLEQGQLAFQGTPEDIFRRGETLKEMGLDMPEPMRFAALCNRELNLGSVPPLFTVKDVGDYIEQLYEKQKKGALR